MLDIEMKAINEILRTLTPLFAVSFERRMEVAGNCFIRDGKEMASEAHVRTLLDSFDQKVEGLKEAVNKLSAAAKQVSDDLAGGDKKAAPSPKPETVEATQP